MRMSSTSGAIAGRLALLAGCGVLVAGCGFLDRSPVPRPTPAAEEIVWHTPPVSPVTYNLADSMRASLEAEFGTLHVDGGYRATVELAFVPSGAETLVTGRLFEFAGELRNPSTGLVRASEKDVTGEWLVRLSPTGRAETVGRPQASAAFLAVTGTAELLESLFRPLPGGPVRRGAAWTDTLVSERSGGERSRTGTAVVRSVWVADTLVAGRSVKIISSEVERVVRMEGRLDGLLVVQELAGTTRARFLWDPLRSLIVRSEERGELTGTYTAEGREPVPLRTTIWRSARLQGG